MKDRLENFDSGGVLEILFIAFAVFVTVMVKEGIYLSWPVSILMGFVVGYATWTLGWIPIMYLWVGGIWLGVVILRVFHVELFDPITPLTRTQEIIAIQIGGPILSTIAIGLGAITRVVVSNRNKELQDTNECSTS
ncbi:hypothetical protein ISR92_03350 [Patescibacteria group bacterium]|nr:hypothetical protein [Patescibacteria group bacterium]